MKIEALIEANKKPADTPKPEFVESDERNGDERTVNKVVSRRIKTLKELAAACEIDTSEWEIYRWKCGAWQTGMKPPAIGGGEFGPWRRESNKPIYSQQFVVMAWMRLKHKVIAANEEINALREKAKGYAPKYPAYKVKESPENLIEFAPPEIHFGSLIWGQETGHDDYDLGLARKAWESSFLHLMGRTDGFKPSKALLILGSDQHNSDNRAGTTEKGTPQANDSRYHKVMAVSRDASIWAIDACLQKYKAVDVVMVPGNHDVLSTWHLGDSLAAWYRRCPSVNIDNSPPFRKYYEFGVNMLLFTHGHAGKLEDYGKTMAAEKAEMWGRTKWREAHTGDKHHRRTIELAGATVRIIPSLRPPCAWSAENNYVGTIRAAEAYVWNRAEGLVGTGVYSILKK
jgi:hypothetical protein